MGLDGILDDVDGCTKTVTVFSPGPEDELVDFLSGRGLEVVHEPVVNPAADPFLVVTEGDRHLGSVDATVLRPWVAATGGPGPVDPAERTYQHSEFKQFLELLAGTQFTGSGRAELLTITREFEDRAWRVGTGRCYATFQQLSRYRPQIEEYTRLGEMPSLDVRVFGVPDWDPPALDGVSVCTIPAESSLSRYWTIAFDGGHSPENACALIAREEAPGTFSGIWTYEQEIVERVLSTLEPYEPRNAA